MNKFNSLNRPLILYLPWYEYILMMYFKLPLILITTGITIIEVSYKEADKLKEMILYLSKLIKILLSIEYPYALI